MKDSTPRSPIADDSITPRSPTADDSMTEKEKDAMSDQMEEFEGPDRREDRGDNELPTPQDPGVGSS